MSNYKEPVLVFNIQGYSIQDGPGVRTTVFLKGCPLHCLWCCNPESQTFGGDVMRTNNKCVRCFRCVKTCTHGAVTMPENPMDKDAYPIVDHKICATCMDHDCVKFCYEGALEDVGKPMTVDEVLERVVSDAPFFKNGGGVTLSGGECTAHAAFCADLLAECKENYIHTCIETTGFVPWEQFEPMLRNTDMVLFDVKHMDPVMHRKLTGVSNELILENLKRIFSETQCSVVIRIPVVPGANDSDENMIATAEYVKSIGAHIVHILPYHRMGMGKYAGLGRDYPMGEELEAPSNDRMKEIQKIFQDRGLKCNIGGNGSYT